MPLPFTLIKKPLARAGRRLLPIGRRFAQDDKGSAVEFGIIAVPFLGLLVAIFEVGFNLLAQQALETGTRDAARQIRTGQAATNFSAAQFRTLVCNGAGGVLADCASKVMIDVRKYPNFAAADFTPPATKPDGTLNVTYQNSCPGEVVIVRTYYDWPNFTNLLGTSVATRPNNSILLTGVAVFRNEPFAATCS